MQLQILYLTGSTVFPRIIAGGDYFFFRTKMGRLFEERRLFPVKYFRQRGAIIRGNMIISLSIRHFRNENETGAEMSPAIVSGIVTGDAPLSYWPVFFPLPW